MAGHMHMPRFKEKIIIVFSLLLFFVCVSYLYLSYLQNSYYINSNGERCVSELTSLKYQLNVVTEYKNRLDKLLSETQKAHEIEKTKFKDIMESCVAMKQQSSICQNQFEDLQAECKRVKQNYDLVSRELQKLKTVR
ncbi:uncharacterized protein LOC114245186 [Bombyx mandarina]|uniref:Uncharacterized protein n=2 Tax=Bombyx TaxID=7090 RepID=A0A8R2QTT8_BOMMO|nr:uncharacterized protein LOC114245186 [Bombyx mandarina]XP_037868811.1 uncharacterized protein LOC105841766 [Bombyx mori]